MASIRRGTHGHAPRYWLARWQRSCRYRTRCFGRPMAIAPTLLAALLALEVEEDADRIVALAEVQFALAAQAHDLLTQPHGMLRQVPGAGSGQGPEFGATLQVGMHDTQVLRIDEDPK